MHTQIMDKAAWFLATMILSLPAAPPAVSNKPARPSSGEPGPNEPDARKVLDRISLGEIAGGDQGTSENRHERS